MVLSTYNNEDTIAEAIQSILSQTYPFFELIIVNDGSTDKTVNIIKSFKDDRIIFIDKTHTNLPDSLNYGIKQSKYDWIIRMDGDDICFPNRFEVIKKYISDDVDIMGSFAIAVVKGKEKNVIQMPINHSEIFSWISNCKNPFIHPTTVLRKSFVVKVGLYDVNFTRTEDFNLWIRSKIMNGKFKNIDIPLLKYRVTEKNREFNYDATIGIFVNKYLLMNNQNRILNKSEFDTLSNLIRSSLFFKVSYHLTSLIHKGRLRYIYTIWNIIALSNAVLIRMTGKGKLLLRYISK